SDGTAPGAAAGLREVAGWIGGPYLSRDDFLQGTKALSSMPGVVYGLRQNIAPATPEFATFREMYLNHYQLPDDTVILQNTQAAFDAVMLSALAIESAGTTRDRVRIRDGFWDVVGTSEEHVVVGPGDTADAVRSLEKGKKIHYKG